MKKLSTGQDSTLSSWIAMSIIVFGEDSKAVAFLQEKAKNSPNGLDEEVIADEGQLIHVLSNLDNWGNE